MIFIALQKECKHAQTLIKLKRVQARSIFFQNSIKYELTFTPKKQKESRFSEFSVKLKVELFSLNLCNFTEKLNCNNSQIVSKFFLFEFFSACFTKVFHFILCFVFSQLVLFTSKKIQHRFQIQKRFDENFAKKFGIFINNLTKKYHCENHDFVSKQINKQNTQFFVPLKSKRLKNSIIFCNP